MDCQVAKMTLAFEKRVCRNSAGTVPVRHNTCKFTISTFESASNVAVPARHAQFMLVQFGLDANLDMVYGIGFVQVNLDNMTFVPPTRAFMANNANQHLQDVGTWTDWVNTYGARYKAAGNVFIRKEKVGGTFDQWQPNVHAEYVLFDMFKVSDFIQTNKTCEAGSVADIIEVVSTAQLNPSDDFYHGVALIAWQGTKRLLDHAPARVGFCMRGMDLGSPCPDNCLVMKPMQDVPEVAC